MWHDRTLSTHDVVIFLIMAVCSCEEPPRAIHTPNIIEAWEGGSCWIRIFLSHESIVRLGEWSVSRHFTDVSHRSSSKYHLVLEVLCFPPVTLVDPVNRSRMS